MAYRGPSGLLGTPGENDEDPGDYTPFPLVDHPELTGYLHREVREWMDKTKPTPEGDWLCFVEGQGRLRFRLEPLE